jgi:SAM-dependent methyltransferase
MILTARTRYNGLHPRFKWYARMKYVMDPCYRAIAPLVPEGAFAVDLGSGLGMLPVLLGLMGRKALGVEWDKEKVACGLHAARDLNGVQIVEGDVRTYQLPACDVITLVDMLHYYDGDTQRALLQRCKSALRPGGRLLVREGDRERRGGARWTRAVENLMVKLGWNRGPGVKFRPISELRGDLESLGFRVHIDEVAGKLHPGNVLLVADL